jgi:hypothetical protein
MSIGGHICFACKRPASRIDYQIGEWVCEGNPDCNMSKGVTREQRAEYDRLNGKAFSRARARGPAPEGKGAIRSLTPEESKDSKLFFKRAYVQVDTPEQG